MIAMEVMELFTSLESNIPKEVEVVKHKFHEQFNIGNKFKYAQNNLSKNYRLVLILINSKRTMAVKWNV